MKTISVRMSDRLAALIAAEARRRGTSKSAVVRDELEKYLRAARAKAELSCLDLGRDLAGCVEGGPADLSTNKKHMEGFGQ